MPLRFASFVALVLSACISPPDPSYCPDKNPNNNCLSADPLFVNPTNGDLHVRSESPARGAADPSSSLTGLAERDLDGDVRTSPADIGADEVP